MNVGSGGVGRRLLALSAALLAAAAAVFFAGAANAVAAAAADPIVGNWNVTYGAPETVTMTLADGVYTETAKTPIQPAGASCALPPGTVIATFRKTGAGTYTGQHGLWYTSDCSFDTWVAMTLSLSSNGTTLTADLTGYGTVTFTKTRATTVPDPIVGNWTVTYGALATVTMTLSGGVYTETAKSKVRVVGASCDLPAGTIIATFAQTGTGTYVGQHGLWYTNDCAFAYWTSVSLKLGDGGLKRAAALGEGEHVTFSKIRPATTTTLSLSAGHLVYGHEQAERVSVGVHGEHGGTPAGVVSVTSGAVTVCAITLAAGRGSCALTAAKLPAGTRHLTAAYRGSDFFASSASGPGALTIAKATSKTTLSLSSAKVTYGKEQAERLKVTVAPRYGGTPTGRVTIKSGATTICAITLARGQGGCTLTARQLRAGTYHLVAAYPGSGDFTGSASAAKTLTVVK